MNEAQIPELLKIIKIGLQCKLPILLFPKFKQKFNCLQLKHPEKNLGLIDESAGDLPGQFKLGCICLHRQKEAFTDYY